MTLEKMKGILRITVTNYDDEILMLINSAELDLGVAGVVLPASLDDLCDTAIATYVRMNFGTPSNYDRLKASYDEQKAQLSMASGYTDWGGLDG